jgi:hypothetical protein
MTLTLDALYADLMDRWKQALGRLGEVDAAVPEGAESVYAAVPAFALSGYDDLSRPSGPSVNPMRTAAHYSRAVGARVPS